MMDGVVIIEGPRIINANTYEEYMKGRESFMNEISALSTVSGITSTSCVPGMEIKYSRVFGVPVDGRNTEKKIELYNIDNRFFNTYGMKILAGEDFAVSPQEDMNKIIVNEAALAYYGYPEPEKSVGKILRGGKQEVVIKAVIKDFNQQSLKVLPKPLAFFNQPSNVYYSVRINPGSSERFIPELEKIWLNHYQGNPFNYFFLRDYYDKQYIGDKRFSALILAASILAIIIACLGLSGLSAYAISRRTKEIGIRKSNGAKTAQVMFLLNIDFLKWVIASIVIAIPLAFFAMENWLKNYAYRTDISWWIFLASGIIAVFIAILTVGWQSYRAASGNPVEALRYE
jgi:putative ABC transport system permease protein